MNVSRQINQQPGIQFRPQCKLEKGNNNPVFHLHEEARCEPAPNPAAK